MDEESDETLEEADDEGESKWTFLPESDDALLDVDDWLVVGGGEISMLVVHSQCSSRGVQLTFESLRKTPTDPRRA